MRHLLSTIPNQLTAARLALLPLMWVLALRDLSFLVGLGVFVCFLTDVLDGYVARRLHQVSEAGSRFDSVADNLLILSALYWLWRFQPRIYTENLPLCMAAVLIFLSSLLIGGVKFKRFANLHLYSGKAAGVVLYLFMSVTLVMGRYIPAFFLAAAGMFIISSTETLLLQLIFPRVDEHMGSLVSALRRGRPKIV